MTDKKLNRIMNVFAILTFLLFFAGCVFGSGNQIVVRTELESTRATVSCTDNKAPNIHQLTSPTGHVFVILNCAR
jgi:hypothetical protein